MSSPAKLPQGSVAWFDMLGTLMCEAALRAGLAAHCHWSFVERYTDGAVLPNGRVQGIRFDIVNGMPSYRVGVDKDEHADLAIEVSTAVARELNLLYTDDPAYGAALERARQTGQIAMQGDPSLMPDWFTAIHDPLVDRTAAPIAVTER